MLARLAAIFTGGGWWLVAIVGAVALGYIGTTQFVLHQRQAALDAAVARNATLERDLDALADVNDANLETAKQLRADHARDLADLAARIDRAERVRRNLVVVRMENARDPDAARPLADACPILDRYFDRVRAEGGGAPDRGQGGAGGSEAPGRAAGLQGRAPAAAAGVDGATGARLGR